MTRRLFMPLSACLTWMLLVKHSISTYTDYYRFFSKGTRGSCTEEPDSQTALHLRYSNSWLAGEMCLGWLNTLHWMCKDTSWIPFRKGAINIFNTILFLLWRVNIVFNLCWPLHYRATWAEVYFARIVI